MLEHVRALIVFVKVAEQGSFRGAARLLALSPSVVSHHVSALEARLRTALLYRSTRRLALTPAGERLLAMARDLVAGTQAALDEVAADGIGPAGVLRVTAPTAVAFDPVMRHLSQFVDGHPGVRLSVSIDDAYGRLIEDGLDLALRMGWPEPGAFAMRRLHVVPRALVASPAYAAERPPAQAPDDLCGWRWIHFAPRPRGAELVHPEQGAVTVWGEDRITTDDAVAMLRFAMAGAGLATLPRSMAEREIAAGLLVEILPAWRLRSPGVYALWHASAPRNGLILRLVEFLVSLSSKLPQSDETEMWGRQA